MIAENIPSYRINIIREQTGDLEDVIARLSKLVRLNPEELKKAREDLAKLRGDTPVTVADRVSWEDISRVAVNAPALPGVTPEVGLSRHYPMGEDYSHVVGYVGPVSDRDLERIDAPDALLLIPRFQIGKIGLERRREDTLRGKAGTKRVEVNAAGRVMRELDRVEGEAGADIQLTLDNALQSYITARLEGESAAAVVMDCDTGDLLACSSTPGYDPNLFVRGISQADYSALLDNKYRPCRTRPCKASIPRVRRSRWSLRWRRWRMDRLIPTRPSIAPGFLRSRTAASIAGNARARQRGPAPLAARKLRRLLLRPRAARRHRQDRGNGQAPRSRSRT